MIWLKRSYLFCNSVRNASDIFLLQIQQDNARLKATPQVQQRMKRKWRHMRFTPPVSTLLQILLVLDPTCRLFPFPILTLANQFIQLNEHLMRFPVVCLFRCSLNAGIIVTLMGGGSVRRRLNPRSTHSTRIIRTM